MGIGVGVIKVWGDELVIAADDGESDGDGVAGVRRVDTSKVEEQPGWERRNGGRG